VQDIWLARAGGGGTVEQVVQDIQLARANGGGDNHRRRTEDILISAMAEALMSNLKEKLYLVGGRGQWRRGRRCGHRQRPRGGGARGRSRWIGSIGFGWSWSREVVGTWERE